jgi:hypothetical protein
MVEPSKALVLRASPIGEDSNGLIKLNDLHALAGSHKNRRPNDWKRGSAEDLIWRLWERATGNSRSAPKSEYKSVYYTSPGRGTFAHPILAAAYAGYLDTDMELEMLDVWLRYRAGDRSLAADILSRAKEEVQKWHDTRDVSKAVRNKYTATLAAHGAKGAIAHCTDVIYIELLGGTTKEVLGDRKLPAKTNLRDTLPLGELLQTMNTEWMASERIEDLDLNGKWPCTEATRRSARIVKEAFERERKDRREPEKDI